MVMPKVKVLQETEDTIALQLEGVAGLHHVHIWALSSTENAMTAHLVLRRNVVHEQEHAIKEKFRHELQHQNIQHITLETEWENEPCAAVECDEPDTVKGSTSQKDHA